MGWTALICNTKTLLHPGRWSFKNIGLFGNWRGGSRAWRFWSLAGRRTMCTRH